MIHERTRPKGLRISRIKTDRTDCPTVGQRAASDEPGRFLFNELGMIPSARRATEPMGVPLSKKIAPARWAPSVARQGNDPWHQVSNRVIRNPFGLVFPLAKLASRCGRAELSRDTEPVSGVSIVSAAISPGLRRRTQLRN